MAYTISDLNWAIHKQFNEDYDPEDEYNHNPDEDGDFDGDSSEWYSLEEELYPSGHLGETRETKFVELEGFGQIRQVEQHGGEGEGDQLYIVISVTDADGDVRLFRRNGWYQSFHGGEYEGPTEEVKAVVRPTTFFEPI